MSIRGREYVFFGFSKAFFKDSRLENGPACPAEHNYSEKGVHGKEEMAPQAGEFANLKDIPLRTLFAARIPEHNVWEIEDNY